MILRRDLSKKLKNAPAIVVRLYALAVLFLIPALALITIWTKEKEAIKQAYKDTFKLLYSKIQRRPSYKDVII